MSVLINASTSGGVGITSDNSGIIQFQSNGANTVTIDGSGNMGIGTASPSYRLDVLSANGTSKFSKSGGFSGYLVSGGTTFNLSADVSANYSWAVSANDISAYTNGSTRMVIDSSGNLLVGVNSATANGGILQLSGGITFPATQVAASNVNTLDDYEEGTFSPTIEGTTVTGTATYSTQVGRYTKIGNRVMFTIYMTYTGGTGTGNLRIGSLPFTSNSVSANYPMLSTYTYNLALTASNIAISYVVNNATQILFEQMPTGGGAATYIPYDAAATLAVSGHYEV